MTTRRFRAKVIQDDRTTGCGIELPFDPKEVFGKARAPVRVEIGDHSFRTTTFKMAGCWWIPLSKLNREAAGVAAGRTVTVVMSADTAPRTVEVPKDLAARLKRSAKARKAWDALSFTHRKEHAQTLESAKKPETRARRLEKILSGLTG